MMTITERLILRLQGDIPALDALSQWASTPGAVLPALAPDHTRIVKNLRIRNGISEKNALLAYNRLKTEAENLGMDFQSEFAEAYEAVSKYCAQDNPLSDALLSRISASSSRDQCIALIFSRADAALSLSQEGYGREAGGIEAHLTKFPALLMAAFGIEADEMEIAATFLRLGLVSELDCVVEDYPHALIKQVLVSSPCLESLHERIKDLPGIPEPPEALAYVESLAERRRYMDLITLDQVAEQTVVRLVPGDVIRSEPGIISDMNGYAALNLCIISEIRSALLNVRTSLCAEVNKKIQTALDNLYEEEYPEISLTNGGIFSGISSWELSGEDELLIVHAPWLTARQVNELLSMAEKRTVVLLVSGIMGIPEMREWCCKSRDTGSLLIGDPVRGVYAEPFTDIPLYTIFLEALGGNKTPKQPARKTEKTMPKPEKKMPRPAPEPASLPEPAPQKDADGELFSRNEGGLSVFLGRTIDKREVFWSPGDLLNGHAIIIGGSGAGKTETIRCISSELERQHYPVLLIDFHGDMACDESFTRAYEIREGGRHYFNPLDLDPAFREITPLRATSDFVDAIFVNFPTLGIQQRELLVEVCKNAYAGARITHDQDTWNKELKFEHIGYAISASENKTMQTLGAYLGDIFRYRLFQSEEKIAMRDILTGGITHINLRALPESLRALYADLLLRKLYYSVQSLGEIPRGDIPDSERFRIFVVVDEAKLLVGEKQGVKAVLSKYATELRKFGVGIILASQLIGHFNDEILANIAVKFCMKAETKRQAHQNCRYFECSEEELLHLRQGEGIVVTGSERAAIRVVPTWERV